MIPILILALLRVPTCGDWPADRSPVEVRDQARETARVTCRAMGASADACTVLDAMVMRESAGDPCAVHRLGDGELGRGVLGLSCRWHAPKWDGNCEALHDPAISTVVALRIYRRAVAVYGARTWADVQAVYGQGSIGRTDPRARARWCRRLSSRGIDCDDSPRGQLGTALGHGPYPSQAADLDALLLEVAP